MKIINMFTGVVFDLPKEDVNHLISTSPHMFALIKNKKIIKNKVSDISENSILSKISDK